MISPRLSLLAGVTRRFKGDGKWLDCGVRPPGVAVGVCGSESTAGEWPTWNCAAN